MLTRLWFTTDESELNVYSKMGHTMFSQKRDWPVDYTIVIPAPTVQAETGGDVTNDVDLRETRQTEHCLDLVIEQNHKT